MNRIYLGILLSAGVACSAEGQTLLPALFEVHGAADIRAVFDPTFTDVQFDGAKGIATDGDTLLVGRTNKIDSDTAPAGQDPMVPGEVLIYRKNATGTDFDLVGRLNDSVIGSPGVSLVSPDDQYGWTVDIQGNIMAVGAPYYGRYVDPTDPSSAFVQDNTGAGYGDEDETGAVFIYTRPHVSSDVWTLTQILYDDRPVNGERFGHNVFFHGEMLIVTTPRNWTPGYSDPVNGPDPILGITPVSVSDPVSPTDIAEEDNSSNDDSGPATGGGCENYGSAVSVFRLSGLNGQYVLDQYIELPFFMSEYINGSPPVSNGDPLDMQGDCLAGGIPGSVSTPPVHSRIGHGFDQERARDIAVDGEWMITVGQGGAFVYQYDYVEEQYEFFQEISGIAAPGGVVGSAGYTSVSIDNDVAVIGMKKFKQTGSILEIGAIIVLEYDASLLEWVYTTGWSNPAGGGKNFGIGVSIRNDLIAGYSKTQSARLLRYDRVNDELLFAGYVPGAGSGAPANKSAWYDDVLLMSDHWSRLDTQTTWIANIVYATSACPADLNGDGTVNFYDMSTYIGWYTAQDQRADYSYPYGVFDQDDVTHYQSLYTLGCP